jgi:hypothetical protein
MTSKDLIMKQQLLLKKLGVNLAAYPKNRTIDDVTLLKGTLGYTTALLYSV